MSRHPIGPRTKLAGVVGWPLTHTLSPAMHNAAFEAMGFDAVYVPLPVKDRGALLRLVDAVRVLPFLGLNVTMPYKEVMLGLCDEVAALARIAGAVNTVHCDAGKIIGYNTDGRGLIASLRNEAAFEAEGRKITILGAGGAAGAALAAFIMGRASEVTVANRTLKRAEDLLERIREHARDTTIDAVTLSDARSAVTGSDLVVNATPLGMEAEDGTPIPADWLHSGQIVADMIYRAGGTSMLRAAEAAGAKGVGGLGMLVEQGAIASEIWNPSTASAPRDVMRAAAEVELEKGDAS